MNYRSEIDGLRAIAVIPVILFHAGVNGFHGGYVGVDIFFVISGYLISSILISEMQQGSFSLIKFYERRARRILPALFFVVLACFPLAWMYFIPRDFESFSASALAVVTFWSNMYFWGESGYFAPAAELQPLLHTWSLAVEEQFYIFFPVVLLLTWRFGRKTLAMIFVLTLFASLLLAHWGAYNSPSATFFWLPTRAWELLLGSLVACLLLFWPCNPPNWVNELGSILGLLAIFVAFFMFDKTTPFPSLYALIPTVGTALVIFFARRNTWVNHMLSINTLVAVGLVSYSLYLWHQPILAFIRYTSFEFTSAHVLLGILLTLCISLFSYQFVEKPFRKSSSMTPRALFGASVTGAFAICILAVIGLSVPKEPLTVFAEYEEDREVLVAQSWATLRKLSADPTLGVENNSSESGLWFSEDDSRKNLLVVGNSHSKDMFNVLFFSKVVQEQFELARFGVQIRSIGDDFFNSPNYMAADIVMFASAYKSEDLRAFPDLIDRLHADGKQVVLVPEIFRFWHNYRLNAADKLVIQCQRLNSCEAEQLVQDINRFYFTDFTTGAGDTMYEYSLERMQEWSVTRKEIIVLDRMEYVCEKEVERCFAVDDKLRKFFYDQAHHSIEGAEFYGGRLDKIGWLAPILDTARTDD